MPLVHFLVVASHCMPAFLQAASVFGAPANAGAVKATTRLKARIDTSAFIDCPPIANTNKPAQNGTRLVKGCYSVSRPAWSVAAGAHN